MGLINDLKPGVGDEGGGKNGMKSKLCFHMTLPGG